MPSAEEVARYRSQQAGIAALVKRDLTAFWNSLDLNRPEAARDALLRFMPSLVTEYGETAASVAADWYDDMRFSEGVPGRFRAEMADAVADALVESQVRFGAQHLFTDTPTGTLDFLTLAVTKYALYPGRATIARSANLDPAASGWQRVARPGACKFCRMLAGRGGVYKEATAHFASHGDCGCAAVPSWDRDAPEVDVRAYVASERTSRMSPEQRERHNARVRAFLDEMSD
ncbi:hypothetical protein MHY85_03165 [Cellulomonas sp. ACRRI]|uniref:VG15 protein n=1 Tax=Cellulomonas sp. ACRRI TaxID=2918188 RepID=UPI001EF244A9|nr:hypothetical protein [Cellulomonas sp. ACRRI]MCG7284972.1 hypothetical protein [Cellulomonas sp. ACRRI]